MTISSLKSNISDIVYKALVEIVLAQKGSTFIDNGSTWKVNRPLDGISVASRGFYNHLVGIGPSTLTNNVKKKFYAQTYTPYDKEGKLISKFENIPMLELVRQSIISSTRDTWGLNTKESTIVENYFKENSIEDYLDDVIKSAIKLEQNLLLSDSIWSLYAQIPDIRDGLRKRFRNLRSKHTQYIKDNPMLLANMDHDFIVFEYTANNDMALFSNSQEGSMTKIIGYNMSWFFPRFLSTMSQYLEGKQSITVGDDEVYLEDLNTITITHRDNVNITDILEDIYTLNSNMFRNNKWEPNPKGYIALQYSVMEWYIEKKLSTTIDQLNSGYSRYLANNYSLAAKKLGVVKKTKKYFKLETNYGIRRQTICQDFTTKIEENKRLLDTIYEYGDKFNLKNFMNISDNIVTRVNTIRTLGTDKTSSATDVYIKEGEDVLSMKASPILASMLSGNYLYTNQGLEKIKALIRCVNDLKKLDYILKSYGMSIVDLPGPDFFSDDSYLQAVSIEGIINSRIFPTSYELQQRMTDGYNCQIINFIDSKGNQDGTNIQVEEKLEQHKLDKINFNEASLDDLNDQNGLLNSSDVKVNKFQMDFYKYPFAEFDPCAYKNALGLQDLLGKEYVYPEKFKFFKPNEDVSIYIINHIIGLLVGNDVKNNRTLYTFKGEQNKNQFAMSVIDLIFRSRANISMTTIYQIIGHLILEIWVIEDYGSEEECAKRINAIATLLHANPDSVKAFSDGLKGIKYNTLTYIQMFYTVDRQDTIGRMTEKIGETLLKQLPLKIMVNIYEFIGKNTQNFKAWKDEYCESATEKECSDACKRLYDIYQTLNESDKVVAFTQSIKDETKYDTHRVSVLDLYKSLIIYLVEDIEFVNQVYKLNIPVCNSVYSLLDYTIGCYSMINFCRELHIALYKHVISPIQLYDYRDSKKLKNFDSFITARMCLTTKESTQLLRTVNNVSSTIQRYEGDPLTLVAFLLTQGVNIVVNNESMLENADYNNALILFQVSVLRKYLNQNLRLSLEKFLEDGKSLIKTTQQIMGIVTSYNVMESVEKNNFNQYRVKITELQSSATTLLTHMTALNDSKTHDIISKFASNAKDNLGFLLTENGDYIHTSRQISSEDDEPIIIDYYLHSSGALYRLSTENDYCSVLLISNVSDDILGELTASEC